MSDEREKINADIRKLEELKASGMMPGDLAERLIAELRQKQPAYDAKLEGDGAVAQGDGAKAVGKDGTLVEGDYVADGGTLEKHYHLPADASPAELRAAYLNHLFESVNQLQLAGIDSKTASDAEARLNLSAVYTALLTTQTAHGEINDEAEYGIRSRIATIRLNISALAQLNSHNRLVLLGDPGSGKTTFVNFVALCLAGEVLKHKDANLAALIAPLPPDDENRIFRPGKDEQIQPWEHGALLPVRVILRDFAARGLPTVGEKASAKTLWDFIVSELESWALRAFGKPLKQELLQKGGLLLLDGLDEAPEADQRRAQIKLAVEGFAASFPKCRILVTSRIYAYQRQDWRLNGFAESVLAPFSKGQIRNFVERWYAHIATLRHLNSEDAQGRAELLKRAIENSNRLLGLAERPLLLTLMASLHAWRGGSLPEKREELYADAVDLLLDWWESPKNVRNVYGELVVCQPSLAEWLKVDRQKVRALLEELAFQAHASQPDPSPDSGQGLTGTADVPEGDLVSGLLHLSQNPDVRLGQLVDYLSLRAGLLIPRGVGVYTFPHRTFQEYLAACYLTDHDYPDKVAELACADFNRWREVALLAGAKAARGTASAIWSLVDALCYAEPGVDTVEKDQWGAHLAGQALVESGSLNNITERNQSKQARVQKWLVNILETGKLPAIERAGAGETLAALGDPRFDPEHWFLPRGDTLGFILIPAGKFIMGSINDEDVDKRETPENKTNLPEYWLAKYPVTVAQFRAFVKSAQHDFDRWQFNQYANHPVVDVSWYDARAYSDWLAKELARYSRQTLANNNPFWQGLAAGRLHVALPSEAEWEKAARGVDQQKWPWGNEDHIDVANINWGISGNTVGHICAVGIFPKGKSPYGCLDMAGNVWEWTLSKDKAYPYNSADGRESLENSKDHRVVRGGSFESELSTVRCAFRNNELTPNHRSHHVGFRIAVTKKKEL